MRRESCLNHQYVFWWMVYFRMKKLDDFGNVVCSLCACHNHITTYGTHTFSSTCHRPYISLENVVKIIRVEMFQISFIFIIRWFADFAYLVMCISDFNACQIHLKLAWSEFFSLHSAQWTLTFYQKGNENLREISRSSNLTTLNRLTTHILSFALIHRVLLKFVLSLCHKCLEYKNTWS